MSTNDPNHFATEDLDPEGATARVENRTDTDDEECPVCGEDDCERLIHVHFSAV